MKIMTEDIYWDLIIAILVAAFGTANALINVFLSPILAAIKERLKFERETLYEQTVNLVNSVTLDVYDKKGAFNLTDYRKCCLNVHLLFDTGEAPDPLKAYLEDIFHVFYYINSGDIQLTDHEKEIVRKLIRKVRRESAWYIKRGNGVIRTKVHRKLMKLKIHKKEITIDWSSLYAVLISELDSEKYIYKCSCNNNKLIIEYYFFQKNENEIVKLVTKLEQKYHLRQH